MSDQPSESLYEALLDLCCEHGPLLLDLCECRQCGAREFHITPQSRGFEGGYCISCGQPGLDQIEVA